MDSFDVESGLRSGHGGDFGDGVPAGVIVVGGEEEEEEEEAGASAAAAELRLLSFHVLGGSRDGSVDNDNNGYEHGGGTRTVTRSPVNVEAMADVLLAREQMRLNIMFFVRGVDDEDDGGAAGRERRNNEDRRRRGGLWLSGGSSRRGGLSSASSSVRLWGASASAARRRMRLRRLRRLGQEPRSSSVVREVGGLECFEVRVCCFLSALACAIFFGGVFGFGGVSSLFGL